MYSISNNPAAKIDDYIQNVEVKMNSIKTERFDGVYVKLWWKISICFMC